MPVPALKEQIASVTGVLSEQQRLICRGKVLKDDQLLSAYRILYMILLNLFVFDKTLIDILCDIRCSFYVGFSLSCKIIYIYFFL